LLEGAVAMAPLFVQISVSIDGYIEDAEGDLEWFTKVKAVEAFATDTLRYIGAMVFGRTAHALLAEFWKDPDTHDASPDLPEQTRLMNGLAKFVLTHRPLDAEWENSHPVLATDLARIKREATRPIALFAGAAAVRSALEADVVDELRVICYPVLLGRGKPLFDGSGMRRELSLTEAREFSSGATLSRYAVSRNVQQGRS
jgi:dihydrofolate reductase